MSQTARLVPGTVLAVTCCAAIVLGVTVWSTRKPSSGKTAGATRSKADVSKSTTRAGLESFPDPNAPGTSARVFIDRDSFDQDIFDTALLFLGPIRDAGSLDEVREAVRGSRPPGPRRAARAIRPAPPRLRRDAPAGPRGHPPREGDRVPLHVRGPVRRGRVVAGADPRTRPRIGGLARSPGRGPRAAGHRGAEEGRDRELPGMHRPVELHLPDRPRGIPRTASGFARGHRTVHRLPGARRPATCGCAGCSTSPP